VLREKGLRYSCSEDSLTVTALAYGLGGAALAHLAHTLIVFLHLAALLLASSFFLPSSLDLFS
jgi:hypothetical protein